MEDWELAETPMQIPASPPANPSPPANQREHGLADPGLAFDQQRTLERDGALTATLRSSVAT